MTEKNCDTKKRPQSMGEEITNAITHGVGALLSIAGTAVAIVYAAIYGDARSVVSASLYGSGLILLYIFSTLYHSLTNKKAKYVFRVFDHCSIFILILCSYIPICLSLIRGALGWVLFGINAFCAVVGVVFNAIDMKRWHKISTVLYLIMGWSVVFFFPVLSLIPKMGMVFLAGGGILYTVGFIFYKLPQYKYMHSVWHMFVLGGSVLQYFCMLFYALPVK